jgi:hypothetical protein
MKTKHYYRSGLLLIVFISLISVSSLQAQKSLKIQGINNSLADYPLQNIKKVYFPTTTILEVDNGSAVQVQVSSIKKMYFGSTTTTSLNSVLSNLSKTRLYPIPVNDQFTVELVASNTMEGYIKVIDLAGHAVSTQKVFMNAGNNSYIINSTALPTGFYFCKISSASSTEVIKFNKQ